jgi:hypothetical protein
MNKGYKKTIYKTDQNNPAVKAYKEAIEKVLHKIGEHGAVVIMGKNKDVCAECGRKVKETLRGTSEYKE